MVELSFTRNHISSISLPFLSLEIYADEETLPPQHMEQLQELIERAWPQFLDVAQQENLYESLPVNLHDKVLEIELAWTNNTTIQHLNHQYRQKDTPTDVLTFTLLADAENPELWASLPVLQLGSIFISVEYARKALQETPDVSLDSYLLERFIHGVLHLFGMHHDTMEKYNRVVAIQQQVLQAVLL